MTAAFRWFGLATAILNLLAASAVLVLMDSPYKGAYHFARISSVVCAVALLAALVIRAREPRRDAESHHTTLRLH
jgi:hypothetical protein